MCIIYLLLIWTCDAIIPKILCRDSHVYEKEYYALNSYATFNEFLQVSDPDIPPGPQNFQLVMQIHQSLTRQSKGEDASLGGDTYGLGAESYIESAGKEEPYV